METEEAKSIPTAKIEIKPPKFMANNIKQLSQEDEYKEVLEKIEQAKTDGKTHVIISHDLQDMSWQKLSQAGYKLNREVLPRLSQSHYLNADELDQNRVQFTISLTEFNRIDQ